MKSNANRFRRLTSLALVLCLLLSSLPAAFAQEAGEESAGEETVYVAPAVQEPVTEPVAPSVEEPAAPVEEEPVPPVTEEEIVPPVTEEEVVPAVTEEEPTAEPEEEPAAEEAEEAEAEDEPCYVTVRRNTEIFSDSKLTDSEGKVQKGVVLYKTHTEDGIYTVLFAKDGEVQEGYIKADDCEVADEDAVAEYLLLAGADENAVKHTTKDNEKIVLLNAVVTEPAAEATVPEETEAETEPQEEATEAAEETEATEAAEEVTEETEAAEAEEAEAEEAEVKEAEDRFPALKGVGVASDKMYGEPTGVYIYQSDVKKVTIGWDDQYAPYCAIYEYTSGGNVVKRGVTNKTEITVSSAYFGFHIYYIVPCADKGGKVFDDNDIVEAYITTYNQTWRKAPGVKVAQLTDAEGYFSVTLDWDPNAEGYEIAIWDENAYEPDVFVFDNYSGEQINRDASKTIVGQKGFTGKSGSSEIAVEKTVVDKAAYKVTHYFTGPCYLNGTFTKRIAAIRFGVANDNGVLYYGKASSWKTLKVVPQWSKAPKITSFKQTSDVECESRIEWTFTGEPDGFDFYSGRYYLFSCDAPEDTNSAYLDLTHSAPGSYSIKIVPYKNGWPGKASGAKTARMKLTWPTRKLKMLDARMISGQDLLLSWEAIIGIEGYEVYEAFTYGRNVSYSYVGFADSSTYIFTPSSNGYHTYVVRPFHKGQPGVYSESRTVRVVLTDIPPVDPTEPEDPTAPVYRAYVVGNTYPGTSNYLPGCDTDAGSMAAMLRSMTGTKYNVSYQLNRTKSQILSDIAIAGAGAKEGDVFLFYYSGHGAQATGTMNGALCGTQSTYITFAELRAALDKIPGDKIVLLDSCFSGASINKGGEVTRSDLQRFASAAAAAFANPAPKSGELAGGSYYVMTACRMDQTSNSLGNGSQWFGLFTKNFEEACGWSELSNSRLSYASADTNGDGEITLAEAYARTTALIQAYEADWNANHTPDNYLEQVTCVNPANSSFVLFRR